MHKERSSNCIIDVCERCFGVWLDDGELQQLVGEYGLKFRLEDSAVQRAEQLLQSCRPTADRVPEHESHRAAAMHCPYCQSICFPTIYGFESGIVINRCPEGHGVFLDPNELEAILVYSARLLKGQIKIDPRLPVLPTPGVQIRTRSGMSSGKHMAVPGSGVHPSPTGNYGSGSHPAPGSGRHARPATGSYASPPGSGSHAGPPPGSGAHRPSTGRYGSGGHARPGAASQPGAASAYGSGAGPASRNDGSPGSGSHALGPPGSGAHALGPPGSGAHAIGAETRPSMPVARDLESSRRTKTTPNIASTRDLKDPLPVDVRVTVSRSGTLFFDEVRSPQGSWYRVRPGGSVKLAKRDPSEPDRYWIELDNGGALVLRQEPGFRFVWLQVGAGQADPATVGLPEGNPMLSSRRQA